MVSDEEIKKKFSSFFGLKMLIGDIDRLGPEARMLVANMPETPADMTRAKLAWGREFEKSIGNVLKKMPIWVSNGKIARTKVAKQARMQGTQAALDEFDRAAGELDKIDSGAKKRTGEKRRTIDADFYVAVGEHLYAISCKSLPERDAPRTLAKHNREINQITSFLMEHSYALKDLKNVRGHTTDIWAGVKYIVPILVTDRELKKKEREGPVTNQLNGMHFLQLMQVLSNIRNSPVEWHSRVLESVGLEKRPMVRQEGPIDRFAGRGKKPRKYK